MMNYYLWRLGMVVTSVIGLMLFTFIYRGVRLSYEKWNYREELKK